MVSAKKHALLVKVTYRAFLREARRLDRASEQVSLTRPVDVTKWGQGAFVTAADSPSEVQKLLFPGVDFAAAGYGDSVTFDGLAMRRVVKANYRLPHESPGAAVDSALKFLSAVNRLRAADECRSVTRTKYRNSTVDVELSTSFVPALSPTEMAKMGLFPFAYRVKVVNRGETPVQLLGRHWVFSDDKGGTTEVPRNSPGVVGAYAV